MRKFLSLTYLLIFSFASYGYTFCDDCGFDNETPTLGIGILISQGVIKLYDDAKLKSEYGVLERSTDLLEQNQLNICSKYHEPEYGLLHFVCLEERSDYFKIYINNRDVKYIPNDKKVYFLTWEEYIQSTIGIRRKRGETKNNPLRMTPSESSSIIEIPKGHELLCPVEIKGDWIKVKYDCFYGSSGYLEYEGQPCKQYIDNCEEELVGWVKWKENEKTLIGMYLIP